MEWINKLNQAITYIEENLESGVDYAEAAKIACCSTFHFRKLPDVLFIIFKECFHILQKYHYLNILDEDV